MGSDLRVYLITKTPFSNSYLGTIHSYQSSKYFPPRFHNTSSTIGIAVLQQEAPTLVMDPLILPTATFVPGRIFENLYVPDDI